MINNDYPESPSIKYENKPDKFAVCKLVLRAETNKACWHIQSCYDRIIYKNCGEFLNTCKMCFIPLGLLQSVDLNVLKENMIYNKLIRKAVNATFIWYMDNIYVALCFWIALFHEEEYEKTHYWK